MAAISRPTNGSITKHVVILKLYMHSSIVAKVKPLRWFSSTLMVAMARLMVTVGSRVATNVTSSGMYLLSTSRSVNEEMKKMRVLTTEAIVTLYLKQELMSTM